MSISNQAPRVIHPLWRVAQAVSVLSAVAVTGLLLLVPEWGLYLTWFVLIPAVPALLLVAPQVWRNLCPIAVVHQIPVLWRRGGRLRLTGRTQRWAPAVAAGLLFLIIPLRHFLFNDHGPALAAFVVAVLVVALVGGALFAGKSSWCSTFCPVGPVEKLYGQEPLIGAPHAHCAQCVGCTDDCFDRDRAGAVHRMLAPGAEAGSDAHAAVRALVRSPTGVFAAAFPGFVLGYFTVSPELGLAAIYLHVGMYAAASLLLFASAQAVTAFTTRVGYRLAAAGATGLYYWFTVPAVIAATEATTAAGSVAPWVAPVALGALFALIALWLLDAPRRSRKFRAVSPPLAQLGGRG